MNNEAHGNAAAGRKACFNLFGRVAADGMSAKDRFSGKRKAKKYDLASKLA
ncbi:hypothetical protein HBDW_38400 [Herbaspirillum sp. DW155]|uniref:hypothetical protein n=1 Tax=Herbaspirillum sp. DW155 TaxID=3095609 RepID=UPI00308D7D04|nr:hypothetical protein HBDW_38400 [Herbaspirillum sp. DW155]